MDGPGSEQEQRPAAAANGRAQGRDGNVANGAAPARSVPPRDQGAPGRSEDAPAEQPAHKRRRPPIAVLVIIAIVVIAGLIWGVRYLAYASTHQSTDDAMVEADTVVVTSKISERVRQILVDTNQYVRKGELVVQLDDRDEQTRVAQARAALAAQRATAQAATQNVDLTRAQQQAQVEQGQGGIASAQASVSNAAAQSQSAQAQISVAQAAVDTARAQLGVAQAAVPGARESLRRAQADYDRTAALVRTGDVPAAQLDAQRAALATAQSNYRQALDNVIAAQTNITQAQQRVASAISSANAAAASIPAQQGQVLTAQGRLSESATPYRVSAQQAQANASYAQLGSLQAQLRTALDQLAYTKIHSPIDGYVGQKSVEVGATVSPGQSLLYIVPATGVYITANFKETQIGKMRAGQTVDVHVDAYPGTDFQGKVTAIGPAAQNQFSLVPAQNATGNFVKVTQRIPVRIIVKDTGNKPLRPGMSVEASVAINS